MEKSAVNSHHLPATAKVSLGSVNQVVSTADVSICIQNTALENMTVKISSYRMVCTKSCIHLIFNILPQIDTLMPLWSCPMNWPFWQWGNSEVIARRLTNNNNYSLSAAAGIHLGKCGDWMGCTQWVNHCYNPIGTTKRNICPLKWVCAVCKEINVLKGNNAVVCWKQ